MGYVGIINNFICINVSSQRMQQLYRPNATFQNASSESRRERSVSRNGSRSEDPPPKYTPPPSYSTATGAKIARFLRNSIRRSVRRISNSPNGSGPSSSSQDLPPPPNYASVILEINAQRLSTASLPPEYAEATGKSEPLLQPKFTAPVAPKVPLSHTLSSDCRSSSRKERTNGGRRISSEINSHDIARMLSLRGQNPGPSQPQPLAAMPPTAPPFSFSRESLEKIDYDLEYLERGEAGPSTSRTLGFDILNFNRSRNRNSNDSQLALISDGFLYNNGGHSSHSHIELNVDMRLTTPGSRSQEVQRHSEA